MLKKDFAILLMLYFPLVIVVVYNALNKKDKDKGATK